MQQNIVDVIVPVYAGEEETRRCLHALQQTAGETRFEIVVVDDCSPVAELSAWLIREAAARKITLLRNERNRGFVASVNRGMALHPERDVVLLNSDTEVANDWLDRMMRCAYRASDVGTVTPFSNNATICSYPFEGWEGEVPGTLGLAGLDRLCADENAGRAIELPSAVGFCMLIRRACLQQVGAFDEARFGRGYGEENDFSFRARKAGWRNLLCADVFVYHQGGVSFAETRAECMRQGAAALQALHPEYDEVVRRFITADPVRPLRQRLDVARAGGHVSEFCAVMAERALEMQRRRQGGQAVRGAQPVRLHISHSWGGGVERWMQDFCTADLTRRNLVLCGRTSINHTAFQLQLFDPQLGSAPLLCWDLLEPIQATAPAHEAYRRIVRWIAAAFKVESVAISSLIGHALDVFDLGVPTTVVLHDFYPFCPALFAFFDRPCETCGDKELAACFTSNRHNIFWHVSDEMQWRSLREAFAVRLRQNGVSVAAPSRDVFERYARLFPFIARTKWALIPHGLGERFLAQCSERVTPVIPKAQEARLTILMPGRLLPHKGMWLLREALDTLTEFADLILLGTGDFGAPFEGRKGVTVIREYEIDALAALVDRFQPDCALLASVLPESFSYTLSEMQALGIPVVATRMGAFAERIRDGETGFLVEPDVADVIRCLRALDADRSALMRVAAVVQGMAIRTAAQMVADFDRLEGLSSGTLEHSEVIEGLIENLFQVPVLKAEGAAFAAEAAVLRGEVAALQANVNAHSLLVQNREAHLAELQTLLDAQAQRVHEQALSLQQLQAERDALKASLSWRVTRPLRAVGRLLASLSRQHDSAAVSPPVPHTPVSPLPASSPPPVEERREGVDEEVVSDPVLSQTVLPPILEVSAWEFEPNVDYRQTARRQIRARLGVPDRAMIVVGVSDGGGDSLRRFVDCAAWVTAHRTRVSFVWVETDVEQNDLADVAFDLGLLTETRDLFVVAGDARPWLLGADVYLDTSLDGMPGGLVVEGLVVLTLRDYALYDGDALSEAAVLVLVSDMDSLFHRNDDGILGSQLH